MDRYQQNTDRGIATVEMYDLAFETVRLKGKSLRDAAFSLNLNHMSFQG